MNTIILGQRGTDGGETVCTTRDCSACAGRVCIAAFQACQVPEPEPATAPRHRFRPTTREGWGRAIGAGLGLGGFLLFAREAARLFFT